MFWRRAKLAAPSSPTFVDRLDRERALLEHLVESADNAALAEMAKIKLRVVNFLRTTPSAQQITDSAHVDELEKAMNVEVPRTLSIAPAAHLIDLQRQWPMLEKIHESAPKYEPTREPVHVAEVLIFSATNTPPPANFAARHPVAAVCLFNLWLITAMFTFAWISSGKLSPLFMALPLTLVIGLPVIWFVSALNQYFETPLIWVGWRGIYVNYRLYRWHRVDTISLAVAEDHCDCEIQLQNGKVISATLTLFEPSFDEWLRRLRIHLTNHAAASVAMERPVIPLR